MQVKREVKVLYHVYTLSAMQFYPYTYIRSMILMHTALCGSVLQNKRTTRTFNSLYTFFEVKINLNRFLRVRLILQQENYQ